MDKQFIFKKIQQIIVNYPLMECDRCAMAVSRWLRKQDIPHTILRLRTKRRSDFFIVSNRYGMNTAITENGTHYGVEVEGIVFDNLSVDGLSRDEWVRDFHCRSGKFVIDELNSMGD